MLLRRGITHREVRRILGSTLNLWAALLCFALLNPSVFAHKRSSALKAQAASIPGGTQIEVSMLDELNTGKTAAGDTFQASLAKALVVNGRTVAPRGSALSGTVTNVVSAGRLKRPASITLAITQLALSDGRSVSLPTAPYTLDGKSHGLRNAALIGGGAAAGAILGGTAGGTKGAVIGSAVGAGAGTVTAFLTGKQEIVIPAETRFVFTTSGARGASDSASEDRAETYVPRGRDDRRGREEMASTDRDRRERDEVDRDDRRGREEIVFTDRDRRIIREYFSGRYNNLPPGLAKRGGNLPPGLAKKVQRDGQLPPGLQKRVEPFPRELDGRLRPLPERLRRVILGRDAMILDAQGVILDIIESVVD